MWALYEHTTQALARDRLVTWGQVHLRALQNVTPQYDHVIVDEAQDLRPVQLRACVALCERPDGVLLVADASQSIYNRGFSFARVDDALGGISGRTRVLRRNTRSTREIVAGAAQALAGTSAGDADTLAQQCVQFGPKPVLHLVAAADDEVAVIHDYINRHVKYLRLPFAAAAVLSPATWRARQVAEALSQRGLPARYMSGDKVDLDAPPVKVMTHHTAKGLEFPIVALLWGSAASDDDDDDADERSAAEQQARRVFFVEATRAMKRLLVTAQADQKVAGLLAALDARAWDVRRDAAEAGV